FVWLDLLAARSVVILRVILIRLRRPPGFTLFPYTTLFRSRDSRGQRGLRAPSEDPAICSRSAASCRAVRAGRAGKEVRGLSDGRSEEHTSELQSRGHLVCRLLLEKKKRT